ncbi:MAG: LuxR family transcriptional regulator [Anaerolineae bacterium]|nr:LuxR family transcriptional regulator [Anaerolineae bacterium]
MGIQILSTKLHIPPPRSDWVTRERLLARLDEADVKEQRLTLISAPAGFGKTSLLCAWAARHPNQVGWFSLDTEDNTPVRFWAYLIAALQTVAPCVGEEILAALDSPQLPPTDLLLTHLINDLDRLTTRCYLVLDDYHAIDARALHDLVAFLVEHAPPQLHLVVASRSDPPWSLHLLRARRQMVELRASDLRFSSPEIRCLFKEILRLDVSSEDITLLDRRTEGWITGLQLAAHSLQGRRDASSFVREFAGSNRFVLDYLVEEVLSRQPLAVQSFLMQTAVLERMTGPLCEALTGQAGGAAMLQHLEEANLFLIPLDDNRQWYRYHALFADLLRYQLSVTGAALGCASPAVLHQRASIWYETEEIWDEAIHHALVAGDFDRAAGLIESTAMLTMARGELAQMSTWIRALPETIVGAHPWLCVYQAWINVLGGQWDLAPSYLERAEAGARSKVHGPDHDSLLGHVASIQAYRAVEVLDIGRAIDLANRAEALLPEKARVGRSINAFTLGNAYRFGNDLERAIEAYKRAVAFGKAADVRHILAPTTSALGRLHVRRGELHLAEQLYRDTLERLSGPGGRLPPIAAGVCGHLGDLYYEWNDLETALSYLRQGQTLSRYWMNASIGIALGVSLAKVLRVLGEVGEADAIVQEAAAQVRDHSVGLRVANLLTAHQGYVCVFRQDREAATRWIFDNALSVQDDLSYVTYETYVALMRVLILLRRYGEADMLARRLLSMVERSGCAGNALELRVIQAVMFQEQGLQDEALAVLSRTFPLARSEQYIRTFLDHGASILQPLIKLVAQGISLDYIELLVSAFRLDVSSDALFQAPDSALTEPLTERELEVLRLMTAGLNNTEIAQTLFVALSTVKKHINHIFSKLNVQDRTQAVIRARELGYW